MNEQYRLFIQGVNIEPAINPSGALMMGAGTSTSRVKTDVSGAKFVSVYSENSNTSDAGYGFYWRHYVSGAGASGDALRAYGTVQNVAAGTVRGAHISLSFASTGTVTGLGVALECTLHIANQATQAGTLAPLKLAIHSDGSTSDPAGSALSYIRVDNQGDSTGGADVDDDAFLFDIQGHTIATGNMVAASTTEANYSHSIKIRVASTTLYLMCASAEG